ncbi:spermidine synthase [Gordonia malaquae]|uniref:Polyamine aminopropyltransferase n=1 Tax=Gordonia malaquae NBRC 108250 TaxID=1223542 RepID=M3ULD0_GORML|nr:polyamine aminopropyltransferase [Gordonia malaquae]GAC80515.1 spermidine synthase [Gordonia malaquae NBRC 108250]SEE17345.1 spermidine synthase [Gordonia malaquae]
MTPETTETSTADSPLSTLRPRLARSALLAVVFICAACGLAYELALISLGSFLIGNTATQASIVLSVMVFAMGIGSLAAKPLQRWPATAFAIIELLLAFIGGLSVLALYAAFAYLSIYTSAMVVIAFVLGLLIGAEIPLLMVLLQKIRRQDAGSAVADMFAVDYVGALVGGLCFPFLLLPMFGQLRGALVVGLVNATASAFLVFVVFAPMLSRVRRAVLGGATLLVVAALIGAMVFSDRFEVTARQALYRDPVVAAERTAYQEIVITERRTASGPDTRLFLNGDLQFSSVDEYRYHEALVHPAMAALPDRGGRVLILGGGDGLALREVLRYPNLDAVTLVELDPEMISLSRTDPRLKRLNEGSLDAPRASVVTADAFSWIRESRDSFDVIIIDMPDPDDTATAKLYSAEFYGMVRSHLNPTGSIVVQSGSPYFAPQSFWCIGSTLTEAGLRTVPFHVDVPAFGDWGFHLAGRTAPALRLNAPSPLRFLDASTLAAAGSFPPDRGPMNVPASTLMDPRILRYAQSEWTAY